MSEQNKKEQGQEVTANSELYLWKLTIWEQNQGCSFRLLKTRNPQDPQQHSAVLDLRVS